MHRVLPWVLLASGCIADQKPGQESETDATPRPDSGVVVDSSAPPMDVGPVTDAQPPDAQPPDAVSPRPCLEEPVCPSDTEQVEDCPDDGSACDYVTVCEQTIACRAVCADDRRCPGGWLQVARCPPELDGCQRVDACGQQVHCVEDVDCKIGPSCPAGWPEVESCRPGDPYCHWIVYCGEAIGCLEPLCADDPRGTCIDGSEGPFPECPEGRECIQGAVCGAVFECTVTVDCDSIPDCPEGSEAAACDPRDPACWVRNECGITMSCLFAECPEPEPGAPVCRRGWQAVERCSRDRPCDTMTRCGNTTACQPD